MNARHPFPQPQDAAQVPRFAGLSTFMRLPLVEPDRLDTVDIGLIGLPWDAGTTNRAGARHGPREVRNQSALMRKVHHVSRIAPYDLARVADLVGLSFVQQPDDVRQLLERLSQRGFVVNLGRASGQREDRYMHLLGGPVTRRQ